MKYFYITSLVLLTACSSEGTPTLTDSIPSTESSSPMDTSEVEKVESVLKKSENLEENIQTVINENVQLNQENKVLKIELKETQTQLQMVLEDTLTNSPKNVKLKKRNFIQKVFNIPADTIKND